MPLASCSTAASLSAFAPTPSTPLRHQSMCLTAAGAQSRCSTGAVHSGRRRGRHRQQHHGTTSNLSENCFIAFSSGMESWTRDVATAAGAAHTATTTLRSALKATKSSDALRICHSACAHGCCCQRVTESRIDDSSKKKSRIDGHGSLTCRRRPHQPAGGSHTHRAAHVVRAQMGTRRLRRLMCRAHACGQGHQAVGGAACRGPYKSCDSDNREELTERRDHG
jgi:hypothetical protein